MDLAVREGIARIDIIRDGRTIARGTGFLVADGYVLTALHLIAKHPQDRIVLQFSNHTTSAKPHPECWDRAGDWLLLQCQEPPPARAVPLGHLPAPGTEWETYGFPEASRRDGMVILGTVVDQNGSFDGAHVLQLLSTQAASASGAPIDGLIGAPVLVQGAAAGLLRYAVLQDQTGSGGTLYATPIDAIVTKCGDLLNRKAVDIKGKRLGAYEVIREIGRGGMGTVYLASRADDQFRKLVALKVLRAEFDTAEVLRRFKHERQILAALSHANIATLLDAGSTPAGEPYFVMDYIEGLPLDRYCDSHALNLEARIHLFQQVCSAVQYVHQNLIVHRDLKPSNILVTSDGTVKLLDFGIAKILSAGLAGAEADVTRTAAMLMTPAYASPEQVRGEPITTATDIYSLGVILYELFTGQRPYKIRSGGLIELSKAICEDEPSKPSTAVVTETSNGSDRSATKEELSRRRDALPEKLQRILKGDLDNIILKAMRKETSRRYASATELAEDLQRHLKNLPVSAHEDTFGYRTGKFIRRYKGPVAFGAAGFLLLIAGTIAIAIQAKIARTERAKADSRFEDVRKLATTFLFDVHDSIQNLSGSTPARSLIARTGTDYLDRLARESQKDPQLQLEVAEGYLRIGDVEGNPYLANLGDAKKSIESYRKALAIAATLAAAHPKEMKYKHTLAMANTKLSAVLMVDGNTSEALAHSNAAVALADEVLKQNPNDVEAKLTLANVLEGKADLVGGRQPGNMGRSEEAAAIYEHALRTLPDLSTEPAKDAAIAARVKRARAVLLAKLGDGVKRDGAAALRNYNAALEITDAEAKARPNDRRAQELLSALLNKIAYTQQSLGDSQAALATYQRAMKIDDAGLASDPTNQKARDSALVTVKNLGDLYFYHLEDYPAALACYRRAAALLEQAVASDPSNVGSQQQLAETLTYVGSSLVFLKKTDDGKKESLRGLQVAKALADRPAATRDQVYNYAWLASSVDPPEIRDFKATLPYALKAVEMSKWHDDYSLHVLAQTYAGLGDFEKAVETEERAIKLFPPLSAGAPKMRQQRIIEESLELYRQEVKKRHK